jgi:quercetin dioxygenase-like cupin family protein
MDQENFKEALRLAGYTEITRTTTPTERHTPEHAHAYDVRGMVLAGSLTLTWDGQTKTYGPGDIYTMPRERRHSESLGLDGVSTLSGRKY